jgi:hypothetical protein
MEHINFKINKIIHIVFLNLVYYLNLWFETIQIKI